MKLPELTSYSLRRLRSHLDDGIFAIPKLQREFVWSGSKAAALLDSVYRGMPIGSLVVWRTHRSNRNLLRSTLHVLPPFNPANPEIWFLIDGQQRLSVLHQAFRGEGKINGGGQTVDFGRLTFDLTQSRRDDEQSFHYRKPVERELVPVQQILASNWRRQLGHLTQAHRKRAENCRERLLAYRVPALVVSTDDLEEVRELFVRINTQGMRIGSADRAFARATEFDLRGHAQQLRDELPESFRSVAHETALQALALIEGVRDVGERSYEGVIKEWAKRIRQEDAERRRFSAQWGQLQRAFGKAVEYLGSNFHVRGEGMLPSANMLVTLALFFYHHPRQPTSRQRREIAKWFWATAVAERYSGRGFRVNILSDADFFARLARNGAARFTMGELVDRSDVRRAEYGRRSSIADAFLCLLASQGPRRLTNGEEIPEEAFASAGSRKHQHHIFPRALLIRHGFGAKEYNALPNICLVVAEENREFGAKHPIRYLEPYRRKRHFARTMRSHLVPHTSGSTLWQENVKRGFRQFQDERLELICREFERAAGIRLFR